MTTSPRTASLLPPIRVLPIPEYRPLPLQSEDSAFLQPNEIPAILPYVQDALAVEFLPRRSDAERTPTAAQLPDPTRWLTVAAQALLEVMAGLRPPAQVVRTCAPEVYLAVSRRYASAARRAQAQGIERVRRPKVTRVHVHSVSADIVEAAVLLVVGPRVRAMAIRVDGAGGSWRITALELG